MEISKVFNEISAGVYRVKELHREEHQKTLKVITETVLQLCSSTGTTNQQYNYIALPLHIFAV